MMAASTPLLPLKSQPFCTNQSKAKPILIFLTKLFFVLFFLYSLNLAFVLSFGPKTPSIHLNSLSLSNLTVSDSKLAANWAVDISLYNPNMALGFSVDRLEGLVLYKDEDALSVASVDGFSLGLREEKNIKVKFGRSGWEGDQPMVEHPVLRDIGEDRRNGTVHFGVSMRVFAMYTPGWIGFTHHVVLDSYCLDLIVGVVEETGNGSLVGNVPQICPVLMHAD